jgi:hypothetical protein
MILNRGENKIAGVWDRCIYKDLMGKYSFTLNALPLTLPFLSKDI